MVNFFIIILLVFVCFAMNTASSTTRLCETTKSYDLCWLNFYVVSCRKRKKHTILFLHFSSFFLYFVAVKLKIIHTETSSSSRLICCFTKELFAIHNSNQQHFLVYNFQQPKSIIKMYLFVLSPKISTQYKIHTHKHSHNVLDSMN